MDYEKRKEAFLKRHIKRDFILFKMPVKNRAKMTEDYKVIDKPKAVFADKSLDIPATIRAIQRKGGKMEDGNFPNLLDRNKKVNPRVAELKDIFEQRTEDYKAMEAQIRAEIESKEAAKVDEVKKRLGKESDDKQG